MFPPPDAVTVTISSYAVSGSITSVYGYEPGSVVTLLSVILVTLLLIDELRVLASAVEL